MARRFGWTGLLHKQLGMVCLNAGEIVCHSLHQNQVRSFMNFTNSYVES